MLIFAVTGLLRIVCTRYFTLREDDSRVRKEHATENMAMVRHIILNMLQNTKKKFKDMSIRRLQKKAGWGDLTLDTILMAAF